MKSVGRLIKELSEFPENAKCHAYEGEEIGITIDIKEGDILSYGFVSCSPSDEDPISLEDDFNDGWRN